ncbi:Retrovirus-related Pol polyprotein, partial [Mucuna pruriens]
MFQKVEINIPLLHAIKQIPKYAKFLKELCIHKRRKMKGSRELGGVVSALTKNNSTVGISQVLPKKCRDPEIFSVPCTIGDCTIANVMLDLGASINVMPTSTYRSLNFGDLEPTGMTIQLAKRSIVQPLGVLEDVLVQVNELIFPADFYVLDMEDKTSGKESTLILGRPFLMTARTKINVHVGTLLMEFGDTLVQFNIFEAMKHPTKDHSLFGIDIMEDLVEEYFQLYSYSENREQDCQTDLKPTIEESPSLPPMELKPLPIIIANNLLPEQEDKLLKVLRQHKKAIGWKLSDLPGINPSICMHKILMEEDIKLQQRLNPTILDVVKKEVTKLLAVGIIYPISDSQWVSPVQVLCIDYRRLNQATRKDQFPLPFIDQMLEKIAGKSHYCFLDRFSGYMKIHIALKDQHKTTFTCPFGTFVYTRMPFGLCNVLSTFQRCMMSIFSDLLQDCMVVFMDDFTMYAKSFEACLNNLSKVLKRCTDTNLVLNFEKCHFMVSEGIVLGHLVSSKGIEVDKAKIDIITSLPNPTYVREVHSFLGHAALLRSILGAEEQTNIYPILQAPDWDLPFELMCDASNSALGAVLGQRAGVGQPRHQNYTTTEKELLEIVFALDNFRSYLLSSKIIVFSHHTTLRYLLKKLDAKSRLIRWILPLQEFDLEIRDKKGAENAVADHLSRIEGESEQLPIRDEFPDEQLLHIKMATPWFADICNYVATSQFPPEASRTYKEKIKSDAKY